MVFFFTLCAPNNVATTHRQLVFKEQTIMFWLEGNLWICLICTLTKPEHNIHLRIDLSMKQKISNQGYTAGRRPECLLCHRDAAFGVQVGRNSLRRKSEQQSWPRSLPSSEARAAGVGRRCETDVIHRPPPPRANVASGAELQLFPPAAVGRRLQNCKVV